MYFGNKMMAGKIGLAAMVDVDDSTIRGDRVWSGKNTVDKLCLPINEQGMVVACEPLEGYPLTVTASADATKIYRTGKNLFDITALENSAGSYYSSETRVLTITTRGKAIFRKDGTTKFTLKDYAPFLIVGQKYTMSANHTNESGNFIYLDVAKTSVYFGRPVTITQAMLDSAVLWYNAATDGDKTPNVISNIQIERGSTATDYEPYKGEEFDSNSGATIPALAGVNTLWADVGEITVDGKKDLVKVIADIIATVQAITGV